MSSAKNERLLNLLICLMSTRQFLSAERIRRAVVAYGLDDSPKGQAAFERKFERDKEALRELGIVIETSPTSYDDVPGYRIQGRDNTLPDIALSAEESTVVALATAWWRDTQFASETQGAVRKLRAAGVAVNPPTIDDPSIVAAGAAQSLDTLLEAATQLREVSFDYRSSAGDPPIQRRRVQPWGLSSFKARWYLVGLDLDRGERRVFRLSRVIGAVELTSEAGAFARPEDVDLSAAVGPEPASRSLRVDVRLIDTEAPGLRRLATQPTSDGEVITIEVRDLAGLCSLVTPYGPRVEVLSPPEARDAVRERLASLAGLNDLLPHDYADLPVGGQ